MILHKVILVGYRNYQRATINFNYKSLIIGANDVGKTNLIWALRLVLDKGLSLYDLEPKDSDFYAYEDTNNIKIVLKFKEVTEECVVARLKGFISDDDELVLSYQATRNPITKSKSYEILAGSSASNLTIIDDRQYRKVINIKYISSRRDFHSFINKEKNSLFQLAREAREDSQVIEDDNIYDKISNGLKKVDEQIPKLSYIANATQVINEELEKLSIHHKKQKIVFNAASSNVDSFISSCSIASQNNGKSLLIGGDGRLNQIYLSLWAARNEVSEDKIDEVSIICIEEPEAHLHPHQQRKLSEYLSTTINAQVIITTHSPQIACEYSPNSIIRLLDQGEGTIAASKGCSEIIKEAFEDFGYRLSIIPAEAFFADVVLLIEGPSEELFYKTLSKQIGIDLDRLNISVLMIDGVGFETFISILDSLEIEWVVRTDNDISKIPYKNEYRFAGVERAIELYKLSFKPDNELEALLSKYSHLLRGFSDTNPPANSKMAVEVLKEELEKFNIYISNIDLENDLFNCPLQSDIIDCFSKVEHNMIVKKMQERKAIHMYEFLKKKKSELHKLSDHSISAPLIACKEIIEGYRK